MSDRPEGWERAQKALRANLSPRYCRLDGLERYVDGTQYEGMASWYAPDVPMLERAPNIIEPVTEEAIASYVDLLTGQGRFPVLHSGPEEGEDDEDSGLPEEEAAVVDRAIRKIADQSRLRRAAATALREGLGCGTSVCLVAMKRGKIHIEHSKAKWCAGQWDAAGDLLSVEIRYPYIEEYRDTRDGRLAVRTMLHRRVVDAVADTVYQPARASESGAEPDEWRVESRVEHGYGFCPAVWWAHDRRVGDVGSPDGRALHQDVCDEIDALNRSLSQRDRAGVYCGDPLLVEIGVDAGHNPAPVSRTAEPMRSYADESPSAVRANQQWRSSSGAPARRRGPSTVWQYSSPDTSVQFLTLEKDALGALTGNIEDTRRIIEHALGYVRVSPESLRMSGGSLGEVSGKALEWMYRRQLSRCETLREDLRDGWLIPVVEMCLRVVRHHVSRPDLGPLLLADAAAVAPILDAFEVVVAGAGGEPRRLWLGLPLWLAWGQYFEESASDKAAVADRVREDFLAGMISRLTAVEALAGYYGIETPLAYVDALDAAPHANRAPPPQTPSAPKVADGADESAGGVTHGQTAADG